MALRPPGFKRDFTVAQMTAELALRPDRWAGLPEGHSETGYYGRRERRKKQIQQSRSDRRGRKDK